LTNLDYSRVEIASDVVARSEEDSFASLGTGLAISCLWRIIMRSPRSARDDNFIITRVVRSSRPKGKKCRLILTKKSWRKM